MENCPLTQGHKVWKNRAHVSHLQGCIPRGKEEQAILEYKIFLLNGRMIIVGINLHPQLHCVEMSHYLLLFKSDS